MWTEVVRGRAISPNYGQELFGHNSGKLWKMTNSLRTDENCPGIESQEPDKIDSEI